MEIEKATISTLKAYKAILVLKGAKPVDNTKLENGDTTSHDHLLWMIEHCLKRIPAGMSVDKYSRWLGYIQGVLVCRKITTVENERNRIRPWIQ